MPLTSLVGLPGSGKTTVGRSIARILDVRFIDADAEIERRAGKSVRAIFETEGEMHFRDLEEAAIADLVLEPDAVLATGGGAVLRPSNRRALQYRSTVIYLRANPDALFRRLRHDRHRPLLQVNDPLKKMRDLYDERDPLYRETAHFVIETGRPSVRNLVNLVLMQLELAGLVEHLPGEGSRALPQGRK